MTAASEGRPAPLPFASLDSWPSGSSLTRRFRVAGGASVGTAAPEVVAGIVCTGCSAWPDLTGGTGAAMPSVDDKRMAFSLALRADLESSTWQTKRRLLSLQIS